MNTFKFGRNRSIWQIPKLKLANYLGQLPTAPPAVDYTDKAEKSLAEVYLNDQLGCCVISGGEHIRGVTSGNAGLEVIFSDPQTRADYREIGGGGDNGADLQTALEKWRNKGFQDGVKLMGWLAVDATIPAQYKAALYLFENLYFGIECPNKWFSPMPQQSGFVWDVAGSPVARNGHCIAGVGYTSTGVTVSTWGMTGLLTDGAIARYCVHSAGGELYVMLSPDMIAKAQVKSPTGLDWHQLITDFNLIGGNLPVPPDLQPTIINYEDM